MRILSPLLFSLLIIKNATGQRATKCDNVFHSVDVPAKYQEDHFAFNRYLEKELTPVISRCIDRDGELITNLSIVLTIDKTGKVINASFPMPTLTDQCKYELKLKLLEMENWTPCKTEWQGSVQLLQAKNYLHKVGVRKMYM